MSMKMSRGTVDVGVVVAVNVNVDVGDELTQVRVRRSLEGKSRNLSFLLRYML